MIKKRLEKFESIFGKNRFHVDHGRTIGCYFSLSPVAGFTLVVLNATSILIYLHKKNRLYFVKCDISYIVI